MFALLHHQINWTGHPPRDACAFPGANSWLGDIFVSYVVLFTINHNNGPYSRYKRKISFKHIRTLHLHFPNGIIIQLLVMQRFLPEGEAMPINSPLPQAQWLENHLKNKPQCSWKKQTKVSQQSHILLSKQRSQVCSLSWHIFINN